MPGPLEGYRIVEATSMVTGPLATMMLGDQGADVIKVEPPGIGDVMRLLGTQRGGVSALWVNCNRSKRSVVLNLREKRGRELLHRLVATADVFVQNFRPGVVERLDIDEPSLRALRTTSSRAWWERPRCRRDPAATAPSTCATSSATSSPRRRWPRASPRRCWPGSAVPADST
jgi:hypothetical protein